MELLLQDKLLPDFVSITFISATYWDKLGYYRVVALHLRLSWRLTITMSTHSDNIGRHQGSPVAVEAVALGQLGRELLLFRRIDSSVRKQRTDHPVIRRRGEIDPLVIVFEVVDKVPLLGRVREFRQRPSIHHQTDSSKKFLTKFPTRRLWHF